MSNGAMKSKVPSGYHMMSDAAALVPMPRDTLRKWGQRNVFKPSSSMKRGRLTVALYSDEDITYLRELFKHRVHPMTNNPHNEGDKP